jgi:CheY-like chemotaxis protein
LRILIIEDSPERQEILRGLFRDHAWIIVSTAARAKRLLDAFDFDLILLDFDLDGPEKGDSIAEHLRNSRNAQAQVIIHSDNGPGAMRIRSILPSSLRVPISRMTKNNAAFKKLRDELKLAADNDLSAVFRKMAIRCEATGQVS